MDMVFTHLLEQALTGLMRDYHRRLLTMQLAHIDFWDEQVDLLSAEIARALTALGPGDPLASPAEGLGAEREASTPDTPAGPLCFAALSACWTPFPAWTSGEQSCWSLNEGPTWRALARLAACRLGPAWRQATMRARGSGGRGKPAKGIAPGARA
jgi:hypothetical protein